MQIFGKFEAAFDAKDIVVIANCFYPKWGYHTDPTSKKIIELEEWKIFFGKMQASDASKRERVRL